MVIPGHGGPPVGPYDIVIQGNTITDMIPFDPVTAERRGATDRATGDRVIEANGMYVMPGMIDLHMHLRQQPEPIEYVYYLKLAHGVTTLVPAADRGLDSAMQQARASADHKILAPRMYPIWGWGAGTNYKREELENPANAPRIARDMVGKGAHVVSVGDIAWSQELFGAVCKAVWDAGGITTVHLPPSTNAVVQALDAARLGVTMIEHHYGYAEASLDRKVQDFGREYNYNNENDRFRYAGKVWTEANEQRLLGEVADSLVRYGVTMPYWYRAFELWGDLIYQFNKRGGRVAYGTDDNCIWATPGFSNVRELQLLRETGLHSLEVLKAATQNSAHTLRQPRLGLVHPGYLADLVMVDGNPNYNLRFLYSFGALTLDRDGKMRRTRGPVYTIKDGIVIDDAKLMAEVERMVAESKKGVGPNVVTEPFVVVPNGKP
ncbi:MAG: amidohydrolase family protein [Gemmatimonadetes bacterium]|nr:amidohydrolase family protein [Gemmatimonadota bacterium]